GGVLLRHDRLRPSRPGDPDRCVEGMHAALAFWGVGGRAQVHHRGPVAKRHEGMTEPFGQVHGAPGLSVEIHRLPAPEGRGTGSEVYYHVEDPAAHAHDVLRLARRDVREVNAPDDTTPGHRAVGLRHIQPVPDVTGELGTTEQLKEAASVIGVDARGKDTGTGDAQRLHVQLLTGCGEQQYPQRPQTPATFGLVSVVKREWPGHSGRCAPVAQTGAPCRPTRPGETTPREETAHAEAPCRTPA